MTTLLVLLVIFQLKHFLADFPLQTKYMLEKSKDEGWVAPLLAHVIVHATFTFLIAVHYTDFKKSFALGLFDALTHFIIDRVKASNKMLGRFKPTLGIANTTAEQEKSTKYFFWCFGLDQLMHGLVGIAIVWWLVSQR